MAAVKVSEAIEALSRSFNSLDFRAVAVKEGDWKLVTSSLVFSHLSPSEIRAKHELILRKLDEILNNSVRFFLAGYSASDWHELASQLAAGVIHADFGDITFSQVDISGLPVNDSYPSPANIKQDEWKIISAEATVAGNGKRYSEILEECRGKARLLGYTDAYDMIREILRIREYQPNIDRYVAIGFPIYARILGHSVKDRLVTVTTKIHSGLKDVQLNIAAQSLDSRGMYYEPFYRASRLVNSAKSSHEGQFRKVNTGFRVSNERELGFFEVLLIHRMMPVITISELRQTVHLERPTEPFAIVLSQFCPPRTFESRLLNPEDSEEGLNPAEVFEDAVAWLLSLNGYSVIQLRKEFEHLRGTTGYQFGSLDIIAHKPGNLLFVDCDTSFPDEKKRNSLLSVKERLTRVTKGGPTMTPAIFTPRDCSQIIGAQSGVVIIDRSRLQRLYGDSMRGKPVDIVGGLI